MKLFKRKTKKKLIRICPYCGGTNLKIVRKEGLAPLNIWDDIVCLDCKEEWEKGSKKDKQSKYLAKQLELSGLKK